MKSRIDRQHLHGMERIACTLLDAINQHRFIKDRLHATIGEINAWWIHRFTGKVWQVFGAERLEGLEADHGVILAANHRSFFDLFVCTSWIMNYQPQLARRLFFPVRSGYFYTHPFGIVMNVVLSAGSMWPPVFRDSDRRELNRIGLRQLSEVMEPGSLIGIHPEGKRGKGPDPYQLLPAKPGLGILLEECHPDTLVLPYFTLGLENNLGALIRRNARPKGSRGEPVRMRFGQPMKAGELRSGRTAKESTQAVMDAIVELGEEDRAWLHEQVEHAV